ncbi:MAG: HupE/UreJ family protein [Janthinobacterium lividum]
MPLSYKPRWLPTRIWSGWLALLALLLAGPALAHPVPNSVVLLDIRPASVAAELQLPLQELQPAFGHGEIARYPDSLLVYYAPALRAYLRQHIHPTSPDGRPWTVQVGALRVGGAEQTDTGSYQQLLAQVQLLPPPGTSPRTFTLHYDVIVHQVVTHVTLVAVRQDWETGRFAEHPPTEVGVIRLSPRDNVISPLQVHEAAGGWWAGFRGMVGLGTQHIAAGTDHLLFLLVLLLPAPLLMRFGRWDKFGGVRYSVRRLLLIVSAFTLGHSLTLLLGALGWVRLPTQPIEALIAVSILVSAGHAWRPVFAGREAWVAAGFGLMHGLAFASTLAGLHLDAGRLALSILGFNLGIELMQLFVIALTVPWLLLLSRTPAYPAVRVGGAGLAGVAALAWLAERLSGQPNALAGAVARAADYAPWLLALLATGALLGTWRQRRTQAKQATI